jgi:hypothetical protein
LGLCPVYNEGINSWTVKPDSVEPQEDGVAGCYFFSICNVMLGGSKNLGLWLLPDAL